MAARVSFTSDDSGSYYYDMFFHQQSLFASVLTEVTPQYSVLFTGGFEDTSYRENDGVNRVNQGLIDNGTYLTGGVVGGPREILGFGSEINLTGSVPLNDKIIIDEPPAPARSRCTSRRRSSRPSRHRIISASSTILSTIT